MGENVPGSCQIWARCSVYKSDQSKHLYGYRLIGTSESESGDRVLEFEKGGKVRIGSGLRKGGSSMNSHKNATPGPGNYKTRSKFDGP